MLAFNFVYVCPVVLQNMSLVELPMKVNVQLPFQPH